MFRGPSRFIVAFIVGTLVAFMPLVLVSARFAVVGEIDLLDTDESLIHERLHGPISESFAHYKLRMTEIHRPGLVVIGSSRVMQIRASFFDQCQAPSCVYNAGGAAPTMRTAAEFVEQFSSTVPPKLVLLGLDVWHFNPVFGATLQEPPLSAPTWTDRLDRAINLVRAFTPRLETDPDLRAVITGTVAAPDRYRGARAILRGEGFRPDGSYAYGNDFLADVSGKSPAERSADAVDRIARGCCRFERFDSADQSALGDLERLLRSARSQGTEVIAFTLPFADEVVNAVSLDEGLRRGFADVDSQLALLFERQQVPFLRLTRLSDVGCKPVEMLDGFHPSEVCAARIVQKILLSEGGRPLRGFADPARLAQRIGSASSALTMPD